MEPLKAEVRGTVSFLRSIDAVLTSPREELLIALGRASFKRGWLLLVDDSRLADEHEVRRDAHTLFWSGDLTSSIYAEAKRSQRGVVLVHAHEGGDDVPELSTTDRATAEDILPHFGRLLPDVPHAYVVVNHTHACGWMQLNQHRRPIGLVRVASTPLRSWPGLREPDRTVLGRDHRQIAALGGSGVRALRASAIGIVGLGGAGSQVAEMLAHAGVGALVLADPDHIEDVNLSRTHGTSPGAVGTPKTISSSRMIQRISPETSVVAVEEAFPSVQLLTDLRDAAVIVSCVDNTHARNELNRFSLRYAVPLIDVGTTISPEPFAVDGHLSVVVPGGHCLRCLGHVSDALLAETDEAARAGDYGTNEGRPQVVSFNGILASAAVTEVLKLVTGFAGEAEGSREWHYDPLSGELRRVMLGTYRCRECDWYGLMGDGA